MKLQFKVPQHPTAAAYQRYLDNWNTEFMGKPVTLTDLSVVHWLAPKRRFGLEVVWAAMALRNGGATVGQYCAATGAQGAAHNWTKTNLVDVGFVTRAKADGHIHLELTDKGIKALQAAVTAVKAAPKPKKARKKAEPKAAEPVTQEPEAPVTEAPQAEATPQAA